MGQPGAPLHSQSSSGQEPLPAFREIMLSFSCTAVLKVSVFQPGLGSALDRDARVTEQPQSLSEQEI